MTINNLSRNIPASHSLPCAGRHNWSFDRIPRPIRWCGPRSGGVRYAAYSASSLFRFAMSAITSKKDMCGATRDIRYGPKADIVRRPLLAHALRVDLWVSRNRLSDCQSGQ